MKYIQDLGAIDIPEVSLAIATSPVTVLVIFSCDMNANARLLNPTNYAITHPGDPGADTRAVSSVTVISPTVIQLTLDGAMSSGASIYRVDVSMAASGPISDDGSEHLVSPNYTSFGFVTTEIEYTAVALTHKTVKVTFAQPMVDNEALRCTGAFVFDPPLEVSAVTPEAVAEPTYVILDVEEMEDDFPFTVTVKGLAYA